MRRALVLLLALLAALPAAPASAEPADFYEVEAALMCDTCNVPLNIAESTRADQQRRAIRRLIAQGKTKQEILDIFVAEYGPNILADPQKAGGSPAVWLVPLLVLLGAAASLLVLLPRWRRRKAAAAAVEGPAAPELSPEDAERLERDLALYDR
jgi:cytochrome c-type biogenesis protein CcmH